jgi:20S proteasome alpha/beta subunit
MDITFGRINSKNTKKVVENVTAIISYINKKYVLISADRRRSDFDEHNKFKEVKDDWAIKTEKLTDHIVIAAAGEAGTITNAKDRLKIALNRGQSYSSLNDLFSCAQSIFVKH